ncbi:class I SAM-dependent methyltransferase [Pendulispora brunnea]|uniref:Class I SAM-dependent methyltransferase n=1 Tax=Pendulispora brunnea TaxID=2905690 RepID=A0ABZ2JYY4_9BACT
MRLDRLRRALREGDSVRDEDFDDVLPLEYRRLSTRFWTPVRAARRASQWLEREGALRVLDVGAGVGKFCVVGALGTRRTRFIGVEHRKALAQVASDVASMLGARRATIFHGHLEDVDIRSYDAFYFFNPFAENVIPSAPQPDDSVELSSERFQRDIGLAERLLIQAPAGTPVVTYCGYGKNMPHDYRLVCDEYHAGPLRLWVKDPFLEADVVRR